MVTNLTSEKLNSSLGDADYDNDNHVFSIQPVVLNSKTDGEIILMSLKMAMIKMILRREKLPPNHLPPNIHQRKRKNQELQLHHHMYLARRLVLPSRHWSLSGWSV